MAYLTPADYRKSIQADNLGQVLGGDPTVLPDAESTAIEKAVSKLRQKYIVDREFQNTTKWDIAATYHAYNRVYLDPPAFSASTIYTTAQLVTYQAPTEKVGSVYKSKAGSAAHAFDATEWDFVAYQYAIYNAVLPKPEFNVYAAYNIGNQVFWKDKVYTCLVATIPVDHETAIQYPSISDIPLINVFPDDPRYGLQYWGSGISYSILPNVSILDTTKWAAGDSRSKLVVWCVAVITLYYIHARISPNNIPDLRIKDYNDAIKMLNEFKDGENGEVPNLQRIQPRAGARIRYGGNVKNQNSY